jgi:acetyl esterase/lipase
VSRSRRGALAGLGASLLAACTPLGAYNALTPRPWGVRRIDDLAYGPLPRQKLDLYLPRPGAAPAPLMVFFYGGGWETGAKRDYAFAARAYAGRGFAVAVPDYRLTDEVAFPAFLQDCALATAWCQAQAGRYGVDAGRTVLAGHSAGAYNAAMLALDRQWLGAAQAAHPIRAWAGLAGPYDFLPLEPGPGLRTFGSVTDLGATQPVNFVAVGAPAAYLACGDKDTVVRPRNTERLANRLQQVGAPVLECVYPGMGHAEPILALAWPMRLKWPVLAESTGFLTQHLKPGA